jgi:beta-glucosidase/6-phospho-beta-glucosidase/beta-galactosidase
VRYTTETGIADRTDSKRAAFIDQYSSQVIRAVNEGYDVRGFMYWTLVDNFEVREKSTRKERGLICAEEMGRNERKGQRRHYPSHFPALTPPVYSSAFSHCPTV